MSTKTTATKVNATSKAVSAEAASAEQLVDGALDPRLNVQAVGTDQAQEKPAQTAKAKKVKEDEEEQVAQGEGEQAEETAEASGEESEQVAEGGEESAEEVAVDEEAVAEIQKIAAELDSAAESMTALGGDFPLMFAQAGGAAAGTSAAGGAAAAGAVAGVSTAAVVGAAVAVAAVAAAGSSSSGTTVSSGDSGGSGGSGGVSLDPIATSDALLVGDAPDPADDEPAPTVVGLGSLTSALNIDYSEAEALDVADALPGPINSEGKRISFSGLASLNVANIDDLRDEASANEAGNYEAADDDWVGGQVTGTSSADMLVLDGGSTGLSLAVAGNDDDETIEHSRLYLQDVEVVGVTSSAASVVSAKWFFDVDELWNLNGGGNVEFQDVKSTGIVIGSIGNAETLVTFQDGAEVVGGTIQLILYGAEVGSAFTVDASGLNESAVINISSNGNAETDVNVFSSLTVTGDITTVEFRGDNAITLGNSESEGFTLSSGIEVVDASDMKGDFTAYLGNVDANAWNEVAIEGGAGANEVFFNLKGDAALALTRIDTAEITVLAADARLDFGGSLGVDSIALVGSGAGNVDFADLSRNVAFSIDTSGATSTTLGDLGFEYASTSDLRLTVSGGNGDVTLDDLDIQLAQTVRVTSTSEGTTDIGDMTLDDQALYVALLNDGNNDGVSVGNITAAGTSLNIELTTSDEGSLSVGNLEVQGVDGSMGLILSAGTDGMNGTDGNLDVNKVTSTGDVIIESYAISNTVTVGPISSSGGDISLLLSSDSAANNETAAQVFSSVTADGSVIVETVSVAKSSAAGATGSDIDIDSIAAGGLVSIDITSQKGAMFNLRDTITTTDGGNLAIAAQIVGVESEVFFGDNESTDKLTVDGNISILVGGSAHSASAPVTAAKDSVFGVLGNIDGNGSLVFNARMGDDSLLFIGGNLDDGSLFNVVANNDIDIDVVLGEGTSSVATLAALNTAIQGDQAVGELSVFGLGNTTSESGGLAVTVTAGENALIRLGTLAANNDVDVDLVASNVELGVGALMEGFSSTNGDVDVDVTLVSKASQRASLTLGNIDTSSDSATGNVFIDVGVNSAASTGFVGVGSSATVEIGKISSGDVMRVGGNIDVNLQAGADSTLNVTSINAAGDIAIDAATGKETSSTGSASISVGGDLISTEGGVAVTVQGGEGADLLVSSSANIDAEGNVVVQAGTATTDNLTIVVGNGDAGISSGNGDVTISVSAADSAYVNIGTVEAIGSSGNATVTVLAVDEADISVGAITAVDATLDIMVGTVASTVALGNVEATGTADIDISTTATVNQNSATITLAKVQGERVSFDFKGSKTGSIETLLIGSGNKETGNVIVANLDGSADVTLTLNAGNSENASYVDATGMTSAATLTIIGGNGEHTVQLADGGREVTVGGTGVLVEGGSGNDTVNMSADGGSLSIGNVESVVGGDGIDNLTLTALQATASFEGGANVDSITLANGENTISLSIANVEEVNGGTGNDDVTITTLAGNDDGGTLTFDGGNGDDSVTLSNTGNNDLTVVNVETVNGGSGNDTITVTDDTNVVIVGGAGADNITGGNGDDTITGGTGNDVLAGGNGDDTFNLNGGNDEVSDAGVGSDIVSVTAGVNLVSVTDTDLVTITATSTAGTTSANVDNGVAGNIELDGAGDFIVNLGNGDDVIAVAGTGEVDIGNAGNGEDTISVASTVTGNVDISVDDTTKVSVDSDASGGAVRLTLTVAGNVELDGTGDYEITMSDSPDVISILGNGEIQIGGAGGNADSGITVTGDANVDITVDGTALVDVSNAGSGTVSITMDGVAGNLDLDGTGDYAVTLGNTESVILVNGNGDVSIAVGEDAQTAPSTITLTNDVGNIDISGTSGDFDVALAAGDDVISISGNSDVDITNAGNGEDSITLTGDESGAITIAVADADKITLVAGANFDDVTVTVANGIEGNVDASGSSGSITFVGGNVDDVFVGGAGADTITAGDGDDVLELGGGRDRVIFGANLDVNGNDDITGAESGDSGTFLDFSAILGSVVAGDVLEGTGTSGASGNLEALTASGANIDGSVFIWGGNIDTLETAIIGNADAVGAGNLLLNEGVDAVALIGSVANGEQTFTIYRLTGGNLDATTDTNEIIGTVTFDDGDSLTAGNFFIA